jgi:hypothetical protein
LIENREDTPLKLLVSVRHWPRFERSVTASPPQTPPKSPLPRQGQHPSVPRPLSF